MQEVGIKQGGKAAAERDFPANKQRTGLADYSLLLSVSVFFQMELSLPISFRGAP